MASRPVYFPVAWLPGWKIAAGLVVGVDFGYSEE